MARKRSNLAGLLAFGAVAAAGYMIYRNRELIRGFIQELTAAPEEPDFASVVIDFEPAAESSVRAETDIVIDRTAEEAAKTAEEA